MRIKRGTVHVDGRVFWSYMAKREYWVSPEHFILLKNKTKLSSRRAYKKDIEKSRTWGRAWSAKNKEKKSLSFKNWALKNKDHLIEKHRLWAEKNKDKILAYRKTAKFMAYNCKLQARRRAAKRNCPVSQSLEEKFLYEFCQALGRGGVKHHVDHIIPVSKGGSHDITNLRIIPAITNVRKGNRIAA